MPLYDCSLNTNGMDIRCNDGSCRALESDCPQIIEDYCPEESPYRCSNGMCASDSDACLQASNGCPSSLPYRCEENGVCMSSADQCLSTI